MRLDSTKCFFFSLLSPLLLIRCLHASPYHMPLILEKVMHSEAPHDEVKRVLKKCHTRCSAKEKALAQKIQDEFLPAMNNMEKMEKEAQALNPIFDLALEIYRDQPKNRLSALRATTTHVQFFLDRGGDFEKLKDKVLAELKNLSQSSEASAETLAAYANALLRLADQDDASAKIYRRCLKKSPKNSSCQKGYRIATATLRQPHCTATQVRKNLHAFVAQPTSSALTQFSFAGRSYSPVGEDILKARDIQRIFLESIEDGVMTAVLKLTAAGSQKLAKQTRKPPARHFVIATGEHVLAAFPFESSIETTYISLKTGPEVKKFLGRLCQTVSDGLPQELRL